MSIMTDGYAEREDARRKELDNLHHDLQVALQTLREALKHRSM